MTESDSSPVKMVTTINSLNKLPQVVQLGRHTQVLLNLFKDEDTEEVYQLINPLAVKGEAGMRSSSLTTLEGVQRFTRKNRAIVARDLANNDKLFLYMNSFGSTLCRSEKPAASAGGYLAHT